MVVDLGVLRMRLRLPDNIVVRVCPQDVNITTGAGLLPGEVLFTNLQLNVVRFPLHPFFSYVFNRLGISPLQVNPNFFRIISVMLLLMRDRNLDLDLIDLLLCYKVSKIRTNEPFYHLYPFEKMSICTDTIKSEKGWRDSIVGISGAWSSPAAEDYPIPSAFGVCSVSSYKKFKSHKHDCPCETCVPRFCTYLCRSLGIPCDDLSYSVCRDRINYLKRYVLNDIPSCSDLLTSDNLFALSSLGYNMSRLQIPSFGRRKNTPPVIPAAGATSSPASASSSATISDTVPSAVATNPAASAPAANQNAPSPATIAPAAAGGGRDKERGKRPHPDSEIDPEEEPLIRRTRVSGPGTLLHRAIRAPSHSGPPAAGGSASASGPPSIPSLPPWAPRYTRTDGTFVKPNETMLKDGQTAMAYYRSMWTPKDIEAAKGLSQKDVFSRFPQSAMETLFGMMAMQKQVEMGNARARKYSDSLEVANKENDLLAMKNTEVLVRLDKAEQERDVLKKENDSLQDEKDALQLEKSVWQTEQESLREEKAELQRLLADEQSARMAFEKRALDERTALIDVISRVGGGMLALHARFSRVGALRYAQGFREGFADRVPDEGQTSSTPDEVDKDLGIEPLGVYVDPEPTEAERIFDECQDIASSRIITAPPTALPLTAPQSSTVAPSVATADAEPQPNDSVIHLDSPPHEGEAADGAEEASRQDQDAVGTEASS
ncbi:uncharacterized protein LOC132303512 [Cornus florida]|uniref:uncharacterized protein LOC132266963 n=3 Tax=Cornus florida TaxID=4283 RepID=UPI002896AC02|nr:uncharacterized protein LOC132266963 [Cornus florida]XP_059645091.1 uncharacterized protein LOC132286731 [Cornus florida]XP_059656771.1 uncharacterized protein LOC132303510 [Cornus florida]XP_059656773.1 uncharacterized protein LOC132303512 [Cornus florida]